MKRPVSRPAGFTLVELMCVMVVAAVLASLAYPAYLGAVRKGRRCEARVALLRAQLAEERYRAEHGSYGDLSDIGIAANDKVSHYTIAVLAADPAGYTIEAIATGAQAADTRCRHLRMTVAGMDVAFSSGPDAGAANTVADNQQCWGA